MENIYGQVIDNQIYGTTNAYALFDSNEYVKKSGDSMSGDLIINTSLSVLGNTIIKNYVKDSSLNPFYFVWNTGLLDVSAASGTGDVTKEYVDGSIANFATNASVGFAFVYNASLGLAFDQYTNASLGLANISYATNSSVNLALSSNASLGNLSQSLLIYNVSIGNLNSSLGLYVTKTGDTMTGNLIINTSLGILGNNSKIDGSLYLGGNLSMGSTNAGYKIAVGGGIYATGSIYASASLIGGAVQAQSLYPTATTGTDLTILTRASCPSANIIFKSMGNTPYETMRCSSIGNVGIRTPYPIYTLDVSGNIHSTGSITIDSSIILNNQLISGLATPVSSSDAVNKWYIDSSLNDTWSLTSYVNTSSYYDGSLNQKPTIITGGGFKIGLRNASGNLYDLINIDASMYFKYATGLWAVWSASTFNLG